MQKEEKFMVRVVSSLSKLVRFGEKEVLVEEGQPFSEILFFVKGEASVYKRLRLRGKAGVCWEEVVLMGRLSEGDVFGEKYYMDKESSGVKIVSTHRGEFIRVSFRDNISTIETPLYKRIRQNAARFPTEEELLEQYKQFLLQKCKQLEFLEKVYKNDENVRDELRHAKSRYSKVKDSFLVK